MSLWSSVPYHDDPTHVLHKLRCFTYDPESSKNQLVKAGEVLGEKTCSAECSAECELSVEE